MNSIRTAAHSDITTTQPVVIKKSAKIATCFNRIVQVIAVIVGTVLFPIIAIAALVKSFNQTKGMSISDRIKAAIAIAVFTIPILSCLSYVITLKKANNEIINRLGMIKIHESTTTRRIMKFFVLQIPFVSSLLVSLTLFTGYDNHSDAIDSLTAKSALFIKQIVQAIATIAGTALFPITGILIGIQAFRKLGIPIFIKVKDKMNKCEKIKLFVRFRVAIAMAILPMPIIGASLFSVLANEACSSAYPKTKALDNLDIVLLSMPFVSSYITSRMLLQEITRRKDPPLTN